eukprot:gb/GECH01008375.1/.p1 GENE.gb/GECH01008375.1/~~gb/GECH01008375.1/.p1  ORF type:complete len:300 (+),score=24.16 gb/GECH01008375.1/:1-900(+)
MSTLSPENYVPARVTANGIRFSKKKACMACYLRHRKCDGGRPCYWCDKNKQKCIDRDQSPASIASSLSPPVVQTGVRKSRHLRFHFYSSPGSPRRRSHVPRSSAAHYWGSLLHRIPEPHQVCSGDIIIPQKRYRTESDPWEPLQDLLLLTERPSLRDYHCPPKYKELFQALFQRYRQAPERGISNQAAFAVITSRSLPYISFVNQHFLHRFQCSSEDVQKTPWPLFVTSETRDRFQRRYHHIAEGKHRHEVIYEGCTTGFGVTRDQKRFKFLKEATSLLRYRSDSQRYEYVATRLVFYF